MGRGRWFTMGELDRSSRASASSPDGHDIGKIDELVRQCGADPRFWQKMAGILVNGDEMHWYEHPDDRGLIGLKHYGDVDPRVLCK